MLDVLNQALEREIEVLKKSMAHEEFGEVGFTNEDRKLLITLGVEFKHFVERFDNNDKRFEKVERRLDELEKIVWKAIAYASGASAVVFTVLKLVWK
jgi:hypothetical protein